MNLILKGEQQQQQTNKQKTTKKIKIKGEQNHGLDRVVSETGLCPALQQLLRDRLWDSSAPPWSLSQMWVSQGSME